MLGVVSFLADGGDCITAKAGSDVSLTVAATPTPFVSPVAYTDPQLMEDDLTFDDYGRSSDDDEEVSGDEESET